MIYQRASETGGCTQPYTQNRTAITILLSNVIYCKKVNRVLVRANRGVGCRHLPRVSGTGGVAQVGRGDPAVRHSLSSPVNRVGRSSNRGTRKDAGELERARKSVRRERRRNGERHGQEGRERERWKERQKAS